MSPIVEMYSSMLALEFSSSKLPCLPGCNAAVGASVCVDAAAGLLSSMGMTGSASTHVFYAHVLLTAVGKALGENSFNCHQKYWCFKVSFVYLPAVHNRRFWGLESFLFRYSCLNS